MPSLSVEPDASADTWSGAAPDVGVTASAAAGGASFTVTVFVALPVRPPVSATVTVTV